jgi:hypothetical protein
MKNEYSPHSMASSSTLAVLPMDGELSLSDSHTTKSSCSCPSERSALTPLSEGSDEAYFHLEQQLGGRKRAYEDDDEEDEGQSRYSHGAPFADNVSLLADYSALPFSKVLCAS